MEQVSSSNSDSCSASHEILCSLWNMKTDNCLHKNLPTDHIVSTKNSLHTFTPYFFDFYRPCTFNGVMAQACCTARRALRSFNIYTITAKLKSGQFFHSITGINLHRTHIKKLTNSTFTGLCIIIYFYNKTNQMHQCIKLFYFEMTLYLCLGRSLCPSPGVQDCTYSNRHLSNRGARWNISFLLHVSYGLSVHRQVFKTVHTATSVCQTDTAVCLLAGTR